MNIGKVLLILGGGGVRGLAHIGVLKALERLGISISEYAGTSVGAIVAAMAASGMKAGEIEKIGLFLRQSDLFDFNYAGLLTNPGRIKGLCKGERLRQFIKRVIPADRFNRLQKPLFLGAVNIGDGEMTFWGMNHDRNPPLHDAIYASCAIPGIFPPQKIGEAFYVDGGVVDSLPLQLAKIRKPDLIIAVSLGPLNPLSGDEIQEDGIFSIMERFYEIKNREMLECRRCSEAETPLILIEPDVGDHRFFKVQRRRELIQKGEAETLAVLKSHAFLNKGKARRYTGIDERGSHAAPSLSLTV
ncbi:patatin-like phospholipase family protein [Candidatus Manganitrophus noduliformans]|uniref:Patatin-like phospholipase family protein n=1 Tax=Candidatus Manganitrophus noduliformans TaxID=2606439 RepID=A0A7X6DNC8_9BACT|nr:patatin-like phospholipase family protein [Candidatus Manganitrophus noduliformans]NKE70282.1 patatin-like phospholipase family protein [Candidatus Manganitrophus noduliformans]